MKRRRSRPAAFEPRFPGRFQCRAVSNGMRCVFVMCRDRAHFDEAIDHLIGGSPWFITPAGVVKDSKTEQPLMTVCRIGSTAEAKPGRASEQ